jgi:predicted nucleic acid-binding protein
VILDTNLLIAYERNPAMRNLLDDDDLAVAALTVAEFRVGIECADTRQRAEDRTRVLAVLVGAMEVLPYTELTAVHHARLLAHTRRRGVPRQPHDLIIAAHAVETGRVLLSRDATARFHNLPGLTADIL